MGQSYRLYCALAKTLELALLIPVFRLLPACAVPISTAPVTARALRCLLVLVLPWVVTVGAAGSPPERTPWRATALMTDFRAADFDGVDGRLAVDRIGVEMGLNLPYGGGLVTLRFSQESTGYRGDNDLFAGGGNADVAALGFGVTYRRWEDEWRGFIRTDLFDSVSDAVDFGDGGYLELISGAVYSLNERLDIGLIASAESRIEGDPVFRLLPAFEYRFDERNRIGLLRTADPAFGYSYSFDQGHLFYIALQQGGRQFRVDDKLAAVDKERGMRIGGSFRSGKGLTTEAYVGTAERELDFYRNGSRQKGMDLKSVAFYSLAARLRF